MDSVDLIKLLTFGGLRQRVEDFCGFFYGLGLVNLVTLHRISECVNTTHNRFFDFICFEG